MSNTYKAYWVDIGYEDTMKQDGRIVDKRMSKMKFYLRQRDGLHCWFPSDCPEAPWGFDTDLGISLQKLVEGMRTYGGGDPSKTSIIKTSKTLQIG